MRQLLWIIGVASILATRSTAGPAAELAALDGRWKVVSVKLAGATVSGLEGATLDLAGGTKFFTLPDGRIERGSYTLDLSQKLGKLDATTEGRDGIEPGIFAIDGDVLMMCLATRGGPRPQEFAAEQYTDHLLIVLRRDDATTVDAVVAKPFEIPTGGRSFRMGFIGFVPGTDLPTMAASHKFVRENGDILAHHIEGVPWAEALDGQPFPDALLKEWESKKLATPLHGKVYLAISPGRGDLKVADKAGPLPPALAGKAYDDPLVIQAYLNYCRRAIAFFKPDYLAIGIEVNEIYRDGGPKTWNAYAALHRTVYEKLKQENQELPIFASWTLHQMFRARGEMLEAFLELMPFNDLVAVSYYPFFVAEKDRLPALDWMTKQFDALRKPYAFVETNDAAERLALPLAHVVIEGTPEKQAAYYARILSMARDRNFAFVISFVHQDYDALWDQIKPFAPELFVAWRDCGLLDETGKPRPAYQVWKAYFDLPLTN